jgi:hypothetical protein
MPPTALMFVVCQALANQGPLDVNGFPIGGMKLDYSTCRNEIVQMYDRAAIDGPNPVPNFADPNVCSRMAMLQTPRWQDEHRGWYVLRVKCPHPDGSFPGDQDV